MPCEFCHLRNGKKVQWNYEMSLWSRREAFWVKYWQIFQSRTYLCVISTVDLRESPDIYLIMNVCKITNEFSLAGLDNIIESSSRFTPDYPQKLRHKKSRMKIWNEAQKNKKLMSWWWQLLLDHGNESVENGNESLKLRSWFVFHPLPFTFFLRQEPFISFPISYFTFCYPPRKEITFLSGIVLGKRVPSSSLMCYKIIKKYKKWSESL